MRDTTTAEIARLILRICYHGGGCSEESNNTSLGTKAHFEQVFSQGSVHYTLSLAAGIQHLSISMVYTELDIHSSPHVMFSHMAQISEKTLIKKYSVFNFFLHLHLKTISFEVIVFFVLCG